MNFKPTLLFLFSILFLIGYSSCKDKEECVCSEPFELTSENTCRCPSDQFYQLGSIEPVCDFNFRDQPGQCEEKTDRTYLMFHDCKCSRLTEYDSSAVELANFLNVTTKRGGSSATDIQGTFTEMADGNEYEFTRIQNSIEPGEECSGGYFALQGYLKGKFNADNTFSETTLYWRFPGSEENRDSCTVTFRR